MAVARVHERRATGRRGAIPGVVVRGSVRVIEARVTREQSFSAEELQPRDYQRWRDLRAYLHQCEETRRQQFRFRKNPVSQESGRLPGGSGSSTSQVRFAIQLFKEDIFPPTVSILLVWKDTEMPDEATRERYLAMFQEELADVLDWDTARMSTKEGIIYT